MAVKIHESFAVSTFSEKFIPASTLRLDNVTDYELKKPSMNRVNQ